MKRIVLSTMLMMSLAAVTAKPLVVAHRGASAYAPENTVVSQQLAWDLGADGAEFDVYLTKDNKVMVMHDKSTSRTSNGEVDLDMKKASSQKLEKIDVGMFKDKAFEGEKLPYLKDMMDAHPKGKILVIEIKDGPETAVEVAKQVKATGRPSDEFIVISFNFDTCVEARKQLPECEVYFLKGAKNKETKKIENFTKDILNQAKEANLTGVNLDYQGVTKQLVDEAKDMGLKFLVWTVDGKDDVQRMTKFGVGAITTNRPDTTRRYINDALGNGE